MSSITAGDFGAYSSSAYSSSAYSSSAYSSSAYSSQAPSSRLRMTKRGRAVLLTIVATPLVAAALAFGINAGGATATSSSSPLQKITVVNGETLWAVAKQIAPNADPRDVVADLMNVNRLGSADIYPGEHLSIPSKYAIPTK